MNDSLGRLGIIKCLREEGGIHELCKILRTKLLHTFSEEEINYEEITSVVSKVQSIANVILDETEEAKAEFRPTLYY